MILRGGILVFFFLPVTIKAILLEGDHPVTKPPLRAEFLWYRRSNNGSHSLLPAEPRKEELHRKGQISDQYGNQKSLEHSDGFSKTITETTISDTEIKSRTGHSAVKGKTSAECMGRGHSWGCGPFHNVQEQRGDRGYEQKYIKLRAEGSDLLPQKRESSQPMRGWMAENEWCLQPTGQFPYPFDCRRFVNCWNGKGFVQPCAIGTLFNEETLECDFPSKVKGCLVNKRDADKGSYIQKIDEKKAPNISWKSNETEHIGAEIMDIRISHRQFTGSGRLEPNPKTQNLSTSFLTIPPTTATLLFSATTKSVAETRDGKAKKLVPICPELSGIFSHPHLCSHFVNCHEGRGHSMMCPPGTLFDVKSKQCDHAYKVKCSSSKEVLKVEESRYVPISHSIKSGKSQDIEHKNKKGNNNEESPNLGGTETAKPILSSTPSPSHISSTQAPQQFPLPEENFLQESHPLTPNTGQQIRLRGGKSPWEGYVEVYMLHENGKGSWSPICDKEGKWSLKEANVVCRQLGYHRGASIAWQGIQMEKDVVQDVHVGSVQCMGSEDSMLHCIKGHNSKTQCNLKKRAVAVRCQTEYRSLCGISEVPFAGQCYFLVKGDESKHYLSRDFAAEECRKRGAALLSINSQEENDFISEWLMHSQPEILSIMTGGMGMSFGSKYAWMWEETQFAFTYTNWWKGWEGNAEERMDRMPKCMVASRKFPCSRKEVRSKEMKSRRTQTGGLQKLLCKTDYFFWSPQNCSTLTKGAICKRNPMDIGCVWDLGMNYIGKANITASGKPCVHWKNNSTDEQSLCRNKRGADGGGAVEGHPWCYIDQNGSWEECEIPPCQYREDKRNAGNARMKNCESEEFECSPGICIQNAFVCDGTKDCSNGNDELDCPEILKNFHHNVGMKVVLKNKKQNYELEKWVQMNLEKCAKQCLKKGLCHSFSFHKKDQNCLLLEKKNKLGIIKVELERMIGWDHYEFIPQNQCQGMFHCPNGSCIIPSKVCNGVNDCGDRADEMNCTSDAVNFSIRLAGSNNSHEGRLEISVFGRWGVVCDDLFGLADAHVACHELGFPLGAAEAVSHSGFGSGVNKGVPLFLMDNLECSGSEHSLSECKFPGWGISDCGAEEVAGVVCKIPGAICPDDQFHCKISKECIPIDYLCDKVVDCGDGSDEDASHCQSEVLVRLAEGSSHLEGRVEVRYKGVWGTICDDDFGIADAQVICRTLGLGWGSGVLALKDAYYGPGKGPIWLDELHCSGEEETLLECPRFPWGKSNCGHSEDASVRCTAPGDAAFTRRAITPIYTWARSPQLTNGQHAKNAKDILPVGCGIQTNVSVWLEAFNIEKKTAQPRVIGGSEFKLGPIPWQASLRIRSHGGKSVHWCGAVVLSPLLVLTAGHCLQDYAKEAYFVRVGDYDTNLDEGTEQEVPIEEIYLHEEFNVGTYLNHDIAVVKLKGLGIHFDDHVHAACLPPQEDLQKMEWDAHESIDCIISGWGSIGGSGAGYSRTLRSAVVPLLSQAVCRASHVYGKQAIGPGMGCAGSLSEGGSDSCQGDSGGPLICFEKGSKPILYGITSWGQGCGRANKPGVYSRVAFYRNWIDKKVQEAILGVQNFLPSS